MSWCSCFRDMRGGPRTRDDIREIPYDQPTPAQQMNVPQLAGPSAPPATNEGNLDNLPGPFGTRYNDSNETLEIHLVVMGVRPKGFRQPCNTEIQLRYSMWNMNITINVYGNDKSPNRVPIARFPGEISTIAHKIRKDDVVLTIKKKTPASWSGQIGQHGF